jgi:polyisoprenoid-binding protein YceI
MKRFLPFLLLMTMLWTAPTAQVQAKKYTVDKVYSTVFFRVRFWKTPFMGRFDNFDAQLDFDPKKLSATKLTATVKVASVNTNNKVRNRVVHSKAFLDGKSHPAMTFKSEKVVKVVKNTFWLAGKLTIKGKTLPVVFRVKFLGEADDPWGSVRAGFSATAILDRTKFGVTFMPKMIGTKVKLIMNIIMTRKKS